ncbi:tRNA-(ms[2]io[6]A)-hydroxylase [Francisellaceae bacterium]|nr:tRNA-(ms[2]io[6]A)-hydroxylase [Francisellaceae bacterium]
MSKFLEQALEPVKLFLKYHSEQKWIDTVLADFDSFLQDHAACERKASAMANSTAASAQDKPVLVEKMIDLAIEEMYHFKQVVKLLHDKGLTLAPDEKDPYIHGLRKYIRNDISGFLLIDKLLIAAIVEARGVERFGEIARHLPEGKLKDFYIGITVSEAKHYQLFIDLAKEYHPAEAVDKRFQDWVQYDAEVMRTIPVRARLH